MSVKPINPKSQIPNHKQIPISNIQNSKIKFWLLIIWVLVIVWNLVFGAWNFNCYAASCYGTGLPAKKEFHIGLQTHTIFKRYLEGQSGKLRSSQEFLSVSYGLFDWLSIDLKGGWGFIKQHSVGSDEIDYPSYLGGGYGFRLRLYNKANKKVVFGFQHISIHPKTVSLANAKNKAVLDDWQFSLLGSYGFKKITPYLGARWSRLDYIHWIGRNRNRVKSDVTKSVGFITGIDIPVTEKLWVNLEGQFLDSEAVAFSLNYSF